MYDLSNPTVASIDVARFSSVFDRSKRAPAIDHCVTVSTAFLARHGLDLLGDLAIFPRHAPRRSSRIEPPRCSRSGCRCTFAERKTRFKRRRRASARRWRRRRRRSSRYDRPSSPTIVRRRRARTHASTSLPRHQRRAGHPEPAVTLPFARDSPLRAVATRLNVGASSPATWGSRVDAKCFFTPRSRWIVNRARETCVH